MPKSLEVDGARSAPARGATTRAPAARRASTARLAWLIGPALVAGVAYLDPGNVASNMTAGAAYGYLLVWVVVLGNVMAWLIQYLSAKLGIVTGQSLPETLGDRIRNPWARRAYWLQAELVAMATDIAEVIGGAVALNLLFGIPLLWGGVITGTVSIVLLAGAVAARPAHVRVRRHRPRRDHRDRLHLRRLHRPARRRLRSSRGLVPRFEDAGSVLLAASILGATIMPHAIYAHSALARDRFAPAMAALAPTASTVLQRRTDDRTDAPPARSDAAAPADLEELRGISTRACCARPGGTSRIAMIIAGTVNLCILLLAAANLAGVPGTDTLEGAYAALQRRHRPARRDAVRGRPARERPGLDLASARTPAPRSCTACCTSASR